MTTVTDDEMRDSILKIRRSRMLKMLGVFLALLVVASVGVGAVLLAYSDAPDAAEPNTGGSR